MNPAGPGLPAVATRVQPCALSHAQADDYTEGNLLLLYFYHSTNFVAPLELMLILLNKLDATIESLSPSL